MYRFVDSGDRPDSPVLPTQQSPSGHADLGILAGAICDYAGKEAALVSGANDPARLIMSLIGPILRLIPKRQSDWGGCMSAGWKMLGARMLPS